MGRIRPGLLSITLRRNTPESIIRKVAKLPLQGIEWGGDVHVPHGDLRLAAEIGRHTRDAGLETFSYGAYYRFAELDDDKGRRGLEIETVMDTAEALGCNTIRLWAGQKDFDEATADHMEAFYDKACEIGSAASRRGLRIDFEYHGGTFNNSPENSQNLLRNIGTANVQTLWQCRIGITFEERLAELVQLLPSITNVHCFHWGPEGFNDRRPLVEGKRDWLAYLKVLAQSKRDHWVSLEYVKDDAEESLEADSRVLASLVREAMAEGSPEPITGS